MPYKACAIADSVRMEASPGSAELSLHIANLSIAPLKDVPSTEPASHSDPSSSAASVPNGASIHLGERSRLQIPLEKQSAMLATLEAVFESAEEAEGGIGVSELRSWSVDSDLGELPRVESLRRVTDILNQMWASNSGFLDRSAEVLADASRKREQITPRLPLAQSH
jgi:hypothetical protein